MGSEEVGQVICFPKTSNVFRIAYHPLQGVPASQRGSWSSFLKSYLCVLPAEPDLIPTVLELPHFQGIFLHSQRHHLSCLQPLLQNFQVGILTKSLAICKSMIISFNFVAYWCERPDLFAAIADAKPGYERAVAVLRWFIVRQPLLLVLFPVSHVSNHRAL
jgi:hypothetical protein